MSIKNYTIICKLEEEVEELEEATKYIKRIIPRLQLIMEQTEMTIETKKKQIEELEK